jgi:mRNA interferase RelE/StbE
MAYKIVIEDDRIWKKDCGKIPADQLQQIIRKINNLEKDPWDDNTQVKQLQNYELADFRLRVGDYRVLFDKNEESKMVLLFRVLHRSKLY